MPLGAWLVGAFVVTLFFAALAFAVLRPVRVLPRLRSIPPISLRDADGGQVATPALTGGIVVFQFSALACTMPCGDGHQALQELQRRLAATPLRLPVRLVSVVLDGPQHPQALSLLRAAMGAERRWWRVATGDARQLKTIVGGGFAVYYGQQRDGRMTFDPATILADERGIIRAEYRTAAPDPAVIWRDMGLVAQEALSRGPARSLYSAAHLFICYPR